MSALADLAYWPRQYILGFAHLWRFNGPRVALRFTLCNLRRERQVFRVRLFGFSVELRSGTPDLAVAIDSLGKEFAPLTTFADPAGLIIDAGGYIGTAALKLAALFPTSNVLTLEPSAENIAMLRRNVEGIANIEVMQVALAATPGQMMLHDGGSGEWGYSLIALAGARTLGVVPTVTVTDILERRGRERLFLLKLDVEGAEREIVEDAPWLAQTDLVIAELHERKAPGVEMAFERAMRGRINTRLPGEKVMSMRRV